MRIMLAERSRSEAAVVVDYEFIEVGVDGAHGVDVAKSQFLHQPTLQRLIRPVRRDDS